MKGTYGVLSCSNNYLSLTRQKRQTRQEDIKKSAYSAIE